MICLRLLMYLGENLLFVLLRDLLPSASSKVQLIEGGVNNLPDDHSYRAAMNIHDLLQSLTEDDLVLALVSGILHNYSTMHLKNARHNFF